MSNTPPEKPETVSPKEHVPPKPSGLDFTTDEANMLMAALHAKLEGGGHGLDSAPRFCELAMKIQTYRDRPPEKTLEPFSKEELFAEIERREASESKQS